MTSSSGSTLRQPGCQLADQVVNQFVPRNNLLYGIIVLATFHAWKQLSGAHWKSQGRTAVVKDVLQPPKTYCSCQRRIHIPGKADPYDMILQTTNQEATRVQSLKTSAEYQVAAPRFRQGPNFRDK